MFLPFSCSPPLPLSPPQEKIGCVLPYENIADVRRIHLFQEKLRGSTLGNMPTFPQISV